MPTYEYACKDCGERREVVQSFSDDALTVCPDCAGELRKVFSAAGIIFKGSGWHIKDYKTTGNGTAAPANGAADKASSSEKGSGDSSSSSDTSSNGSAKSEKAASTSDTAAKSA